MTATQRTHNKAHEDLSHLLRGKDIARLLGVQRSTLANWAIEFSLFIPTVRQGRRKYFRPEAVEILRHIRNLREEGCDKLQILESLTKEFPIDIDVAEKRAAWSFSAKEHRTSKERQDAVYLAMQSFGEVNERLDRLIQHVGGVNTKNKRLRELLQSDGQTIDRQGEPIRGYTKAVEEQAATLDKHHKQTDYTAERIETHDETTAQQRNGLETQPEQIEQQRDDLDNQRKTVEERDRDLLKKLRQTIEGKEKIRKKRGVFAKIFDR